MRWGINMKFFKSIAIVLTLLWSFAATNSYADATQCRLTSGKIANLVGDTDSSCYTSAINKTQTIYKVYLCKSKPSAPTSSATSDYASKCTLFMSNDGAEPLIMGKGDNKKLPGTFVSLESLTNGTTVNFTYVYLESKPEVAVRATATFNVARTAVDGSSGTVCWTTDATVYSFDAVPTSGSSCGSAAPASPGLLINKTNSLGVGAAVMSSEGDEGGSYLVDSNYKLAASTSSGNMGTVARDIGIFKLTIRLTQRSHGLKIAYDLTTGAWVVNNPSGGTQKTYILPGGASVSTSVCSAVRC